MKKSLGAAAIAAFVIATNSADAQTFVCTYSRACVVRGGCDIAYGKHPGVRPFTVIVDAAARTIDGLPASLHGAQLAWKRTGPGGAKESFDLDRTTGSYQRMVYRADGTVGMVAWAVCRSQGMAF
jgi:hypothetical protein